MAKHTTVVALCAALLAAPAVLAQTWPSRPVRIVMPNPPGGASDLLARMMAPKMSTAFGQPVIVENRSGTVGVVTVANAAPDGYTVLFSHVAQMIGVMFVSRKPAYDPVRDFLPLMAGVESYGMLVARAGAPVGSLQELIDYAKRNPGKLTIGSSGIGTYFHLMGEVLKHDASIDLLHVPYKGVAGVLNGLVAEQIDVSFVGGGSVKPFLKKLKALAVIEPKRDPSMPNVPSINEAVPGLEKLPSWFGFYLPAAAPGPVAARLHEELGKAMLAPDIKAWIDSNELGALASSPAETAVLQKKAIALYGAAMKYANVQPE